MKTKLALFASVVTVVMMAGGCGPVTTDPESLGVEPDGKPSSRSLGRGGQSSETTLAERAVIGEDTDRTSALNRLRQRGRMGLAALESRWANDIECLRTVGALHPDDALETIIAFDGEALPFWWEPGKLSPEAVSDPRGHQSRLEQAFTAVTGQQDGLYSGLFWHQDREAALLEAKELDRPLLSLRILGRLDEELCCAHGRYMRSILYPDPAVRSLLSDRFVLHWSSERPVPTMTVDFGDGRTISRTVNGSAAHYVLTPSGSVVDVLPGIYPPGTFVRCLSDSIRLVSATSRSTDLVPVHAVADHHRKSLDIAHRDSPAHSDVAWEAEIIDSERLAERARRSASQSWRFADEATLSSAALRLMFRDMPKPTPAELSGVGISSYGVPSPRPDSLDRVSKSNPSARIASSSAMAFVTTSKLAIERPLLNIPAYDLDPRARAKELVRRTEAEGRKRLDPEVTVTLDSYPAAFDATSMFALKSNVQSRMYAFPNSAGGYAVVERDDAAGRRARLDAPKDGVVESGSDSRTNAILATQIGRPQRSMEDTQFFMNNRGRAIWDQRLASRAGSLEVSLAREVAVNELAVRPLIRTWFASGQMDLRSLDAVNAKVFAEAFNSPRDDPWLGMLATDLWTGIPNDGAATK